MTIRDDLLAAVQSLIVTHTSATDGKVIFSQGNGPRPALPYLTLKLTSYNRLIGAAHFRNAIVDVAATLDLGAVGGGALDTVLSATTAGAAGNAITVRLVADSAPAAGVSISRSGTALTIHFEADVSTVAHVEAAITALSGGDDLCGVETAGTGATVLAGAAAFGATALAGGYDGQPTILAVSQRASTLSVQSFGAAAYEWLEELSQGLDLPAVLTTLQAAGVAVVELSGGVQDITELLGTDTERRGSFEAELHYGVTTDAQTEVECILVELATGYRRLPTGADTLSSTSSFSI